MNHHSSALHPKSSQDRLGRFLASWRVDYVRRRVEPPVLDVACGDNRLAEYFADATGVDVVDYGAGAIIVEHLDSLTFPSDYFATVTVIASLNYFSQPERVLAECARVLRPKGKLLVTQTRPALAAVWHKVREPWAKVGSYSRSDILTMCDETGLRLVSSHSFMFGMNRLFVFQSRQ
ncbi:hypothetical protein CKO31_16610 [Thiohalocapsa halophila]|uniref:Methyltransferase type 11 domain-containing protein n=1 Tax=Thiohalocapsa halophila TaxID=69359 RepID=A0ABS1CK72_9GAMM|nr:class I SAM-dependent methyltransferase [Thiohalocapsa halophila]MBK1632329.1 hypothetical protein [Thiohalocapsa halophila]